MSEPFLAEVKLFGFNFAPRGWAQCDGQILPINQNQSLYSLLGTTYGGDGRTTFGLPDLRGRVPIHEGTNAGASYPLGSKSGTETHTLTENEMPEHTHFMKASANPATGPVPTNNLLGNYELGYNAGGNLVTLRSGTLAPKGGGQSHNNMQPYLAVNFCIALQGLFPSRD